MPKFNFLYKIAGANFSILALLTAFYMGAENSHIIKRAEKNLLYDNVQYSQNSHKGQLSINEVINDKGELELKLRNDDLEKNIYTFKDDYLPDNSYILSTLETRLINTDSNLIRGIHRLDSLINIHEQKKEKNNINNIYWYLGALATSLLGTYVYSKTKDQ